jgi:hypothetical protein
MLLQIHDAVSSKYFLGLTSRIFNLPSDEYRLLDIESIKDSSEILSVSL